MAWWSFPRRGSTPDLSAAMRAGVDTEAKSSAAGYTISASMVGNPVWTPRNFANLADEAYVRNAVGYRCTKLIAGSAAGAPWLLHDRQGNEIVWNDMLQLLSRPSPMTGGASLFEAFYSYMLLSGSGYLEGVGPSDRAPPKELYAPRSDRMKVVPGPYGVPQAFEYEANGLKKRWQVDPITGFGPILQLKMFHPLNDWYGLSPVEPAAYGVDRHNAASAHNKALLDNGARPSGALAFKPVKMPDGSTQTAPDGVISEAKKTLKANHGGPSKAGESFVFGGNVEWLEMGITPRDMDFSAGKEDAARDICISLGVPHILIVPGQSTYNNVREAKLELWEDTILPLLDKTCDALNAWLVPQFDEGYTLSVDLDAISALEPRRESKRKSIVELLDKGVIDDDEAREALQYGPRKAEAVKKVDAAVLNALVAGAKADPAMWEALFRYMKSVQLIGPETTTIEQLLLAADQYAPDETDDAAAALAPDPAPQGDA